MTRVQPVYWIGVVVMAIAYLRVPYADTEYSDAIARVILTPFL
jgi:hypothetical protein